MILATSLALCLFGAKMQPPTKPQITFTGRVDRSLPGKAVLSWSGTSFAFRFRGTGCQARFQGTKSIYNIVVDGKPAGVLDLGHVSGEHVHSIAKGLSKDVHEVVVTKRTEPVVGIDTLTGIALDGKFEPPASLPVRKIEFIGNSITCGYGNLDSLKEHPFSHHTEDFDRTYASLTAQELKAQVHAICWSGKGLYRNSDEDTNLTMPVLWERTQPTSAARWNHAWHPDVVVIDLGTNDFAKSAPPPERFEATFVKFLERIHAVHPKAAVVLLDGPMLNDFWPLAPDGKPIPSLTLIRGHLERVSKRMHQEGIRISTLSLTPNSEAVGYGADWHPNQEQNRINARELTSHLRKTMGW